ncbi:hypothetical protein VL14_13245 [Cytobacillus firmus]|nr:hypothetical protein VL14_13245 [Cytobacillus firmus]
MIDKQNSKENIQLLKAMRYNYDFAKLYFKIRMLVSIVLPMLSIIFTSLFKFEVISINLGSFFSVIGSLWLVAYHYFKKMEDSFIEKGAKIQEQFDINIFNIDWNVVLIGHKVSPEDIQSSSDKFSGEVSKLKNWYSGLEAKEHYVNVLLSQRSNLMWARSLKQNYSLLITLLGAIYVIATLFIGSMIDISLKDYLLIIFIPSLSILIYITETRDKLSGQVKQNTELGEEIRTIIEQNQSSIDKLLCRQFQDAIYINNRVGAVLIPEFLYWLRRNKDDNQMLEVNRQLSEKANKIQFGQK